MIPQWANVTLGLNDTGKYLDYEFKINKTIGNGRFVLEKQLGKGGHGRVFAATDLKATYDIPIAIKTVRYIVLYLFLSW